MFANVLGALGILIHTSPQEPATVRGAHELASTECVLFATVARDFLGFGEETSPPLAPHGDYIPECPWDALGVDIGSGRGDPHRGLVFRPPHFEDETASVDVLVIYAPRVGAGWRCGFALNEGEWQLMQCARTRAL